MSRAVQALHEDWGRRLRAARAARGWTQSELATSAGSTKAHVSNIERGLTSVGDAVRMQLATALDTTVAELFPYPEQVSS